MSWLNAHTVDQWMIDRPMGLQADLMALVRRVLPVVQEHAAESKISIRMEIDSSPSAAYRSRPDPCATATIGVHPEATSTHTLLLHAIAREMGAPRRSERSAEYSVRQGDDLEVRVAVFAPLDRA